MTRQPTRYKKISQYSRNLFRRRPADARFDFHFAVVFLLFSGGSVGAESVSSDAAAQSQTGAVNPIYFASARSVEGELAETAGRQREGVLAEFRAQKQALADRTGLTFGIDNHTQYLGTDSDKSPSDALSNVFRFYGTWTATGRGTPDNGALIFYDPRRGRQYLRFADRHRQGRRAWTAHLSLRHHDLAECGARRSSLPVATDGVHVGRSAGSPGEERRHGRGRWGA